MSGFLLDTNVISEFARPDNKPDQRVKQWLEAADSNSLYASVLTFGEIRRGIEKLAPGKRRTHLETWLEKDLHEWFENRLLIIDNCQPLGIAGRSGPTKWNAAGDHRRSSIRHGAGAQTDGCYAKWPGLH